MAMKHILKDCENWFNEFNRGRRSLKDEVREGCPKTAVVPENIAVRKLIIQDCHETHPPSAYIRYCMITWS